ncbi:hypothetical protein CALVIDRAFT_391188 [Calocera viscosa TUFC12733]|uniref:Uncharacterized protein n=1 Tax=Calocera viscosa (strain TUFC12733) TaxID=1330018 RepID=A0A167GH75_CALVF|nr:hypothetical protein CALVIDRAFT_391188 [Calocera viscosa TUFC12733]
MHMDLTSVYLSNGRSANTTENINTRTPPSQQSICDSPPSHCMDVLVLPGEEHRDALMRRIPHKPSPTDHAERRNVPNNRPSSSSLDPMGEITRYDTSEQNESESSQEDGRVTSRYARKKRIRAVSLFSAHSDLDGGAPKRRRQGAPTSTQVDINMGAIDLPLQPNSSPRSSRSTDPPEYCLVYPLLPLDPLAENLSSYKADMQNTLPEKNQELRVSQCFCRLIVMRC